MFHSCKFDPGADAVCSSHGKTLKRASCAECNAAYVRHYLRHQRKTDPLGTILGRARDRARERGVQFNLQRGDLFLPTRCPVLGIDIMVGGNRAAGSPSLDRIEPLGGYVPGNVRVISDRANRLKGSHSIQALRNLAACGNPKHRDDYTKIARYVEREKLLDRVRSRAAEPLPRSEEWLKIAVFLDKKFR